MKTIYLKRNAITHQAQTHFQLAYPAENVSKEDIFYYIYGLFHSRDYREKYRNNLGKQLPRIPRVADYVDFIAFRDAGIELAKLHLFYDQVSLYPNCVLEAPEPLEITAQHVIGGHDEWFYVEQMRIDRKSEGRIVKYNEYITIHNIPLRAWEYHLGGAAALAHIMKRQALTTDKRSGITNNANDWAVGIQNQRYPLELFLKVITVSLRTLEIQDKLPKLNFATLS